MTIPKRKLTWRSNKTIPKRRTPASTHWVLTQMRDRGAALHRHHDHRRGAVLTLSNNGREIADHVAAQVIKNPSVCGVGDFTFQKHPLADLPLHRWRKQWLTMQRRNPSSKSYHRRVTRSISRICGSTRHSATV